MSAGPESGERRTFVQRFFHNFEEVPPERPPIIPKPYRIPFFVALSVLALIALILVVRLVVVPGIAAQHGGTPSAATSTK